MSETQVQSDDCTVWVNGSDGMCLGRFSRFGIDIHRSFAEQAAGMGECLDCTHTKPTLDDWQRFKLGMQTYYGVSVGDENRPKWL
jgi:hypothetical protein